MESTMSRLLIVSLIAVAAASLIAPRTAGAAGLAPGVSSASVVAPPDRCLLEPVQYYGYYGGRRLYGYGRQREYRPRNTIHSDRWWRAPGPRPRFHRKFGYY